MTLALALRCSDGLVMATDSRITGGPRQSADISEKFLQVNRDVGVMTYGLAVPGYTGIRKLVEEAHRDPSTYTTMATITSKAQELFKSAYEQFLEQSRDAEGNLPPGLEDAIVGFIIGGYDGNDTAQFRIYSSDNKSDFQMVEQPNIMAAQWHLAALLNDFLAFPGMSVRYGLKVAVALMILTSVYERTVGGPIHLATVTIQEGFTLLHERESAALLEEIQPWFSIIKEAWMHAWLSP